MGSCKQTGRTFFRLSPLLVIKAHTSGLGIYTRRKGGGTGWKQACTLIEDGPTITTCMKLPHEISYFVAYVLVAQPSTNDGKPTIMGALPCALQIDPLHELVSCVQPGAGGIAKSGSWMFLAL